MSLAVKNLGSWVAGYPNRHLGFKNWFFQVPIGLWEYGRPVKSPKEATHE